MRLLFNCQLIETQHHTTPTTSHHFKQSNRDMQPFFPFFFLKKECNKICKKNVDKPLLHWLKFTATRLTIHLQWQNVKQKCPFSFSDERIRWVCQFYMIDWLIHMIHSVSTFSLNRAGNVSPLCDECAVKSRTSPARRFKGRSHTPVTHSVI